ncbi:amphi-Trp domain-containing protein [Streptomyces sp. SS]|uniref:amphi-Trp domain-containing protein n=1 Tax=Streptomyces sp. SS TaxID=260742 RepID=UPI0002D89378|nr:amphi-Trp domain-containing protein [Streptomyces sp. SS]
MNDLKFEQKSSMSRTEAAELLEALAGALREGEEAELRLGAGVLSLRIPDELRSEVEFEVDDGEIELEIELKWPIGGGSSGPAASTRKADRTKAPKPKPKAGPVAKGKAKPVAKAKPEPKAKTEVKAKPQAKKPEVKKPEAKKPEVKTKPETKTGSPAPAANPT